ncbi:MAG: DNA/RNA nuclease SfsA [Bacillota bacterium]|nr:DNA/RNA nuclease SfsA [Bacillota bacterium]
MNYDNIVKGIFIERKNRFIADVIVNDKKEEVHVKNTGRCKEILREGAKIYLQKSDNPKRKTRYSLISAYKGDMLINVDSQAPNQVVFEGIKDGKIKDFKNLKILQKEKTFQKSRFDLYYERKSGEKGFVEIKGVTLEKDNKTKFPDAPTTRGTKHVLEMIDAVEEGYEGNIFFLIQMDKVLEFTPNFDMDPDFSNALTKAKNNGVKIHIYNSIVHRKEIVINNKGFLL